MPAKLILILDATGEKTFDATQIRGSIRHLQGIRDWRDDRPEYQFFAEFDQAGESTIIYIPKDCRYIAIEGIGPASAALAMEIQRLYKEPILAYDGEFSTHVSLREVSSPEELRERMGFIQPRS